MQIEQESVRLSGQAIASTTTSLIIPTSSDNDAARGNDGAERLRLHGHTYDGKNAMVIILGSKPHAVLEVNQDTVTVFLSRGYTPFVKPQNESTTITHARLSRSRDVQADSGRM